MKGTGKATRLLILTGYLYCPPISGGAMRMINPIARLCRTGDYQVTYLFQYTDESQLSKARDYFSDYPSITVAGVPKRRPLHLAENLEFHLPRDVLNAMDLDYYRELERLLEADQFDLIQVEHSWMSWVVPLVRKTTGGRVPVVLDVHNVEYLMFERWLKYCSGDEYTRINSSYERMKDWEREVWKWYDAGLTVSPIETQIFTECNGNLTPAWDIPTGGGMDLERFTGKEWLPGEGSKAMLYLGTMEWYPNMQGIFWFIESVMPHIKKRHADASLYIAGFGKPSGELLGRIAGREDIKYLGEQEDERDLLGKSKVDIVPLWIGAGARVKILTAWAAGIPVVATTIGAEGLRYTQGENILVADDPAEFADHVCRIMEDHDLARKLSVAGRSLVQQQYSLDIAVKRHDEAYQALVKSSQPAGLSRDADYFKEKERAIRCLVELKADMPVIMHKEYSSWVSAEKAGSNEIATAYAGLENSYAWRISRSISNTADRLFPGGTGRQRLLRLVLAGIEVIQDEGWLSFFKKTGRWFARR